MDTNLTTVSTVAVQIATVGAPEEHTLAAEFSFDPADPYAVTMRLRTGDGAVSWTFARSLLVTGQFEPVGDGDVHVWPCLGAAGEAVVIVELRSPSGESLLQFPTRDVHAFARSVETLVPEGREEVDVDAWLSRILDQA